MSMLLESCTWIQVLYQLSVGDSYAQDVLIDIARLTGKVVLSMSLIALLLVMLVHRYLCVTYVSAFSCVLAKC